MAEFDFALDDEHFYFAHLVFLVLDLDLELNVMVWELVSLKVDDIVEANGVAESCNEEMMHIVDIVDIVELVELVAVLVVLVGSNL